MTTIPGPSASNRLRLAVAVLGGFFTLQGLGWIFVPRRAANGLGMPLLDGLGRSTQVGDFAAFFLVAGLTMLAGSRPGRAQWLRFPAALIGGAAITRTLAWLLHGADFAVLFIAIEIGTALLLWRAAGRLDAPA
jgi:hypothetical protein